MFITSTSRLILPVKQCELLPGVVVGDDAVRSFTIPEHCPLVERLITLVKDNLKVGSVDVLGE